MKNLNQLWIVEADKTLSPLYSEFKPLLCSFSDAPVTVYSVDDILKNEATADPELVLFHSDLTTIAHLQQFVAMYSRLPFSSLVIVSNRLDEEMSLLALEAGADDCINENALTAPYLRKMSLLSLRRHRTETELKHSKEQLSACIQNTPNVAVQWYNSKGEVLLWNKASERIFTWTAQEAIGKKVDQLIAMPENKNFWLNKIRQMAASNAPGTTKEWRFRHRNGKEGYCLSTLFPIPSFNGDRWFVCMDVEITHLKEAQNRLLQTENRYHTLFNEASDAIFINDNEGRFLDMNEKACQLTGLSKEQLLQCCVTDLYSEEELAKRPIMWAELLRGERTIIERNLLRADGVEVPIEVTAQMLKDGRIMAIVRDVTKRKKIEEALQQSEEKYRSLIEQQADVIAVFDNEENILDVNTSAMQLLQYSREELQQMKLNDVLWAEDTAKDPVDFAALRTGASTIKQRQMRRKDGVLLKTEVHAKRLSENLFLASVRDLTQRMEVQERLEKEKELSDTIINSLPGLFYLFTKEGRYLRWNRQLETVSGYSADEISSMNPLLFFDELEKVKIEASIKEVFEKGSFAVEAKLLTKDSREIPYYFTGIAIGYAGTDCLLGTGIDLSEVKKLEEKLSEQKIAAQKRIMQAMIAAEEKEKNKLGLELHDNVNQILSVVRMYLSILNDGEKVEEISLPKAMDLLNTAITEIRHLSHSLAVSYKFETGLAGTLEEMLENIRAAKDFSLVLRLPPGLDKRTNGDQKLAVYRIVQEQMSNIIKYARATEVEVKIELRQNMLNMEIADNGQGFRLSKATKGLGLTNIANRAEALDGWVEIDTAPGKGCRVRVHIPLATNERQKG